MWRQPRSTAVPREPKRVVLLGPADSVQQIIARDLIEMGYGVMRATSVEAALAFVDTGLMDAVVVRLSRFASTVLRRLVRGLLSHPTLSLVGAVTVVSAADSPLSDSALDGSRSCGRRSSWRLATRLAGFASARQLSQGLSLRSN